MSRKKNPGTNGLKYEENNIGLSISRLFSTNSRKRTIYTVRCIQRSISRCISVAFTRNLLISRFVWLFTKIHSERMSASVSPDDLVLFGISDRPGSWSRSHVPANPGPFLVIIIPLPHEPQPQAFGCLVAEWLTLARVCSVYVQLCGWQAGLLF